MQRTHQGVGRQLLQRELRRQLGAGVRQRGQREPPVHGARLPLRRRQREQHAELGLADPHAAAGAQAHGGAGDARVAVDEGAALAQHAQLVRARERLELDRRVHARDVRVLGHHRVVAVRPQPYVRRAASDGAGQVRGVEDEAREAAGRQPHELGHRFERCVRRGHRRWHGLDRPRGLEDLPWSYDRRGAGKSPLHQLAVVRNFDWNQTSHAGSHGP